MKEGRPAVRDGETKTENAEDTGARLSSLNSAIVKCRRCQRLVEWREKVAREKVARFSDWEYWGKPVPGFGDPGARLLIVGLAPAAHGANRTGRMFTGDKSGEWLHRTLHEFGFSNRENSSTADDGLELNDCYITAVARCAPPQNKLTKEEIENCRPFLQQEFRILPSVRVVVVLGKLAFDQVLKNLLKDKPAVRGERAVFKHGAVYHLNSTLTVIASYHPSQQNTFTGKLTRQMFESVFRKARAILMS